MATQKPQILLTIDDNLLRRIDDFRFNTRVNSRSEAIRQLIEEGLKKQEKPKTKKK
jgi:metal-responsive CopG/Arc/MetJ family transcriptional regulator